MMSGSRLPVRSVNEFTLEACCFCEFVRNSGDFEQLDIEDEKMYLSHLLTTHGLEK